MRLADGTEYFDFEVREISSLKQSVGNLENPRIVPESASIVIDKKSLSGYDLTNRAIKIINQKSSIVTNRDILFNGFIQFPDGIQETQDTIKIDVENRFAGLSKKLVLKKYRASAGAEYEGKYIPAYFGHFTNAVARLHDATNHHYIVSSLALTDSNDCPIVVRNNGAVVNASNYQINYADAIVDFTSSQGTGAITVDGCGVHRGHTDVIKWILKNIIGLTDAEINDTSFNAITSITIGRKIEQNNFDGLNLLAELLFETLCELTFQNNQAVLHSRYSDSVGEIPVSAIIQQPGSNNRWDERKNSARLYANRVGLDDGSYFYDDLIEQSRVGKIVEKILALKWYQENLAGRNKRLQATAQTFGGQESALISSSFDDRALGVNVGDVRTIEGQDYYVTEKNTESKEQISVGLSLWKRPNRAFAPFITSIKPKSGEPDDFEVEWDSIVGLESVWALGITALSNSAVLAISGAVGTKKGTVDISEQSPLSGTEFEARISNANAISDPVKFYNYPAEILTAQTSSEVVTLTWNVGGNGAGTRTWYGDGKKYRVERKLSSESWAQAVVQDFEGQTTKAWSVQVSGLVAGQTHNLRMYRVQGVVSGAISNVANATPVAGTLTAPVVTVRQDGAKVVATWTQRPNATTYEARWRKGTSGNWTTLRDNVSPVTITENGTSGVYQVEVQAKAYGWTASSWGRGQITFVQTLRDPQFSVFQQSAGSSRFTVRITSAPDSPDQYAIAYRDLNIGSFGWTGGVVVSTITHTFTITAASVPNVNVNANTNPRMGFRVRSRRSGWNPSNYVIVDLGSVTIPAS